MKKEKTKNMTEYVVHLTTATFMGKMKSFTSKRSQ